MKGSLHAEIPWFSSSGKFYLTIQNRFVTCQVRQIVAVGATNCRTNQMFSKGDRDSKYETIPVSLFYCPNLLNQTKGGNNNG